MIAFRRTPTLPIGLEITPKSLTLAQVAFHKKRPFVHALAHMNLPHDEQTPIAERDALTAAILKKLVIDHRFQGRHVVTCLGSQELFVHSVRLPQLPEDEIDRIIRWEAEERLADSWQESEIRHLPGAQFRQDSTQKQEVFMLVCHRGIIQRQIDILQQAGLIPSAIDIEPCAVLRCLEWGEAPNEDHRMAYLSFGPRSTTVIFAEGGRILFLKYVNFGANHLDVAIARHLNLSMEEARRMRISVTSSRQLQQDDELHHSIGEAIRFPLESMASEIEKCLVYYKVTFRGQPFEKFILTGSDASPLMADFVADRFGTECQVGDPLSRLGGESANLPIADGETPSVWTTSLGLSLKGQ